jgi:hypothetical protein
MGLSDIAKFLGSLRAGFAVLQPDVCSAVVKRLQELEVLGRYVLAWSSCSPVPTAVDVCVLLSTATFGR